MKNKYKPQESYKDAKKAIHLQSHCKANVFF